MIDSFFLIHSKQCPFTNSLAQQTNARHTRSGDQSQIVIPERSAQNVEVKGGVCLILP